MNSKASEEETQPATATTGSGTAPDRIELRAHIDAISDTEISGWAQLPSRPGMRCLVVLKEGERVLSRTPASKFRADLARAEVGDGSHAFVIPMPRSLLDGEEHVLELMDEESGASLTDEPLHWRSTLGTSSDIAARGARDPQRAPPMVLQRMTSGAHEANRVAMQPGPSTGTQLIFDLSDLVYYIGHHPNLTGIQRVQSSIILAFAKHTIVPRANMVFLSFDPRIQSWLVIPTGFLISLLEDLFLRQSDRAVRFSSEESRYGSLPGAYEFSGTVVARDKPSVLCLLGAAWVQRDYLNRVVALKRQFGTRFVMTIHDLIPIYARETCDQGTAQVFEEFLHRALRHVDHFLSVSEHTARDLRRYARSLAVPDPTVTVTRNGSSFEEFLPRDDYLEIEQDSLPNRFVLFVATIEGRKNHKLMFDLWRRMLADGDDPPCLVCVGRVGWKAEAFLAELIESDYLDGRIVLLQDVSDARLKRLYRDCLFTLCPSFYEGWGLPVGEALAAGKVCVCSDRASLPEVAGEFGVYINIDDFDASLKVIRELLAKPTKLKQLENKIQRKYRPLTWLQVAQAVAAACETAANAEWQEPYPYPAIPYGTEISFAWLGREGDDSFGEELLARMVEVRKGHFLFEPLQEQNFLWGEESRAGGVWAVPERWGTWLCYSAGELALGLPPDDSALVYIFLRLRASGPISDVDVTVTANDEAGWQGKLGPRPRNIVFRYRRRAVKPGPWRLRLGLSANLSVTQQQHIAAIDSRVPTIGFERLVVVSEHDIKSRLDIVSKLGLSGDLV